MLSWGLRLRYGIAAFVLCNVIQTDLQCKGILRIMDNLYHKIADMLNSYRFIGNAIGTIKLDSLLELVERETGKGDFYEQAEAIMGIIEKYFDQNRATPLKRTLSFLLAVHETKKQVLQNDNWNPDADWYSNLRRNLLPNRNNEYQQLEEGLSSFFNYRLPRDKNGDRQVEYTIYRLAGIGHLRFAQAILRRFNDPNSNDWNLDSVFLADSYGNDFQEQVRTFFKNIQGGNNAEVLEELEAWGLDEDFSAKIRDVLNTQINRNGTQRTLLAAIRGIAGIRVSRGKPYLSLPQEVDIASFVNPSNAEKIRVSFQLRGEDTKYAFYSKSGDGRKWILGFLEDIPLDQCLGIEIGNEDRTPDFMKYPFTLVKIQDEDQYSVKILNLKTCRCNTHDKYRVFRTALFNEGQDSIELYQDDDLAEFELNSSFQFTDTDELVFRCSGEEISICPPVNCVQLDYDEILDISPDKRRYRYFKQTSSLVLADSVFTISCECLPKLNLSNGSQLPVEYCWKNCTIQVEGRTFRNVVFIPDQTIDDWEEQTTKIRPMSEKVELIFQGISVVFSPQETEAHVEIYGLSFRLRIRRQGVIFSVADTKMELQPGRDAQNRLSYEDFFESTMTFHPGAQDNHLTIEFYREINGKLFYFLEKLELNQDVPTVFRMSKMKQHWGSQAPEKDFKFQIFIHNTPLNKKIHPNELMMFNRFLLNENWQETRPKTADFFLSVSLLKDVPVEPPVTGDTWSHELPICYRDRNPKLYVVPVEHQLHEWIEVDTELEDGRQCISRGVLFQNEAVHDSFGCLAFFVCNNNGYVQRTSPGFFIPPPDSRDDCSLSEFQKALVRLDIKQLNKVFSRGGEDATVFCQKIFARSSSVVACCFFNAIRNKIRINGQYKEPSGYVFRNADYWIPQYFRNTDNQTSEQYQVETYWDPELFGYEEMKRNLKTIRYDIPQIMQTSLFWLAAVKEAPIPARGLIQVKCENLWKELVDSQGNFRKLWQLRKIQFLCGLYGKQENIPPHFFDNFDFVKTEGVIAIDDYSYDWEKVFHSICVLAKRIHEWKKCPKISAYEHWKTPNERNDASQTYYYTEQYFRGELIYWRENQFTPLRDLLLICIAGYALEDLEVLNIINQN